MLFRAAFLFIELNALLASTSKIPSVAGSSYILRMAGIDASIPPGIPAHVWIGAVLLISSDLRGKGGGSPGFKSWKMS